MLNIVLFYSSLGTHGYKDNLMSTRPVVNGSELLVNDLYVVDGTRLYASVKCVNTIGLATTIVSSPVLISIEPPRISDLGITIIPSSVYEVVEPEVAVQTNLSNLQFTWDTFADDASVSGYEYRLASMTKRLIHWTDTGKKNFVSAHGLNLEDSQWYTAEVRALDGYGVRSNIINSTILIENSEPTLTGKSPLCKHLHIHIAVFAINHESIWVLITVSSP